MIIKSIHVENLCGLLNLTLNCDSLTALVGGNGCGKSTFLKALQLYYSPSPQFTQQDFYANDIGQDISITITYCDLNEQAQELFAHYIDGSDLAVTRVLSLASGKPTAKFYGSRLQNPAFFPIRAALNKTDARKLYNDIRQQPGYDTLPPVTSADGALDAIAVFEQAHPELSRRQLDEGQFFGFTEVAQGYLGRFTRLLVIPAVRDAEADAAEGRGSAITALMDMVIRNQLAAREDLVALKGDVQQRYRQLMARENLPELDQIQGDLTSTLRTFIADSGVEINWSAAGEIDFPMPRAEVRLSEHGYYSTVGNTGHGLQRTFVLAMLQRLAVEQSGGDSEPGTVSNLVLCIEEPELYQHPIRERNFAKVLRDIAAGHIPGVANTTQVVYTTHSSHFVGIDRFHQIRVFHKIDNGPESPRITQVTQVTREQVANTIGRVHNPGRPEHGYTWESIKPKLHTIMTPMVNGGFFSDTVVLVEGEEDRGAILGVALMLGHDLEAQGISVIPCGGKANIDRPLVIFRQFGVKTYAVWDSDSGRQEGLALNHRLLRLLNQPPIDYPPTQVNQTFACFENRLHRTMVDEIGERAYSDINQRCHHEQEQEMYGTETKNPLLIAHIVQEAANQGLHCQTIEQIVERILEMKQMGSQDYFAAVARLERIELALTGD